MARGAAAVQTISRQSGDERSTPGQARRQQREPFGSAQGKKAPALHTATKSFPEARRPHAACLEAAAVGQALGSENDIERQRLHQIFRLVQRFDGSKRATAPYQPLRSGAIGYVLKSDAETALLSAVDHLRHRQPFFTSKLARSMAENFVQAPPRQEECAEQGELPESQLTPREVQVITLLADGRSNKQVAATLGVSTRTVESHRNHIMRKMSFTSFSDLIRFAIRNNLVSP